MANTFTEFDDFNFDFMNRRLSNEGSSMVKMRDISPEKVNGNLFDSISSFPGDLINPKPIVVPVKVKRKRRAPKVPWRKPLGMPKRPLSAYNLFFQSERERIIDSRNSGANNNNGGKTSCGIGFANLAKNVASKWKTLDSETKAVFQAQAGLEKERYKKEIEIWKANELKVKNAVQQVVVKNNVPKGINPLNIPSTTVLRPSSSLLIEPLHIPSILQEPSMQRRVTFSGPIGMNNTNVMMNNNNNITNNNNIDTVFEGFQKVQPTTFPLRCQSDSFFEVRNNSINSLSCDAQQQQQRNNNSISKSKRISPNIFRFMQELFTDLDDDEVRFITGLNHATTG